MSVTPYFGLEPARAESILAEVKHAVSGWRKLATQYGIPKSEQDAMERGVQVLKIKKNISHIKYTIALDTLWKFYILNYRIAFCV